MPAGRSILRCIRRRLESFAVRLARFALNSTALPPFRRAADRFLFDWAHRRFRAIEFDAQCLNGR